MKELFFLIILVLGVAVGFAGCGDDDETTDAPVESSVDAGGEVADAGAGGEDAAGSDAATGGTGGEPVGGEADAGSAGGDAAGGAAEGGASAE